MTIMAYVQTPVARQDVRPLTVALEGGGSLGAFGWGVLDRLVDAPGIQIKAVSGASAGAINAAMLVQGLATGGPAGAKRLLETFWRRVAIAAGSLPGPVGTWLHMVSGTMAPVVDAIRQSTTAWAPSIAANGANPLRGILREMLDVRTLQQLDSPALVVAATCVRTGEARLFRGADITVDALLASACLPQLFPAVEIDGECYWDGGYSSNPPLRPLIEMGVASDLLIVRSTPLERPAALGMMAVQERVNEITFSAALRGELRSLALAQELLEGRPDLPPLLAQLRNIRVHMIGAEQAFCSMYGGSKQDPTWRFLYEMHDLGQHVADRWLAENSHAIGHHSTIDLTRFAASVAANGTARAAA
jgi:NTE family protein